MGLFTLTLVSCAGTMNPMKKEPVQMNRENKANKSLETMPKPSQKIDAAVYSFRDKTGQYKPSKNSISYSTAVTQGATSILIKAMSESGWFTPIERVGISNLLNERRIIQSTRKKNNDNTRLHPLLFAGVLMEGGIIGYSSNVITGGAGVRYLGMDLSGQFRKDQVTVYLRAVSTQTGEILKSVRTTKSVLSQKISAGVFRYVDANKLLETEAGITFNEPSIMAVTDAIDAAVQKLIMQGIGDGLWQPANKKSFQKYKVKYQQALKKEEQRHRDMYGLIHRSKLRSGFSFTTNFSYGSYIGGYSNETYNSGLMVQLEQSLTSNFSLKLNYQRSQIGSQQVFSKPVNNADLMLNAYLTPHLKLSPYLSLGGGVLAYDKQPKFTR
ncbi:MAG TPA: CsgG/HfaB family protein, partial [Balneolaceae bacterium]|nr:CsgG/HfaB family protein [Balneolaceae bacterium]